MESGKRGASGETNNGSKKRGAPRRGDALYGLTDHMIQRPTGAPFLCRQKWGKERPRGLRRHKLRILCFRLEGEKRSRSAAPPLPSVSGEQ